MTVSKQTNGKKPRSVELYVAPFNAIMRSIVIEDGPNRTELNLTMSQCRMLASILANSPEA